VPARLRRHLPGFEETTVRGHGWASKQNGDLVRAAEGEFDIFVTVDRNLVHQQNMAHVRIPIVVLHARSNRLGDLVPLVPGLLNALAEIQVGQVIHLPRAETDATPAA
jgi:hypothetical protein